MTGVLGGFTTFSAFSLDTLTLFERGEVGAGGALCRGLGRSVARGDRVGVLVARAVVPA